MRQSESQVSSSHKPTECNSYLSAWGLRVSVLNLCFLIALSIGTSFLIARSIRTSVRTSSSQRPPQTPAPPRATLACAQGHSRVPLKRFHESSEVLVYNSKTRETHECSAADRAWQRLLLCT